MLEGKIEGQVEMVEGIGGGPNGGLEKVEGRGGGEWLGKWRKMVEGKSGGTSGKAGEKWRRRWRWCGGEWCGK